MSEPIQRSETPEKNNGTGSGKGRGWWRQSARNKTKKWWLTKWRPTAIIRYDTIEEINVDSKAEYTA